MEIDVKTPYTTLNIIYSGRPRSIYMMLPLSILNVQVLYMISTLTHV